MIFSGMAFSLGTVGTGFAATFESESTVGLGVASGGGSPAVGVAPGPGDGAFTTGVGGGSGWGDIGGSGGDAATDVAAGVVLPWPHPAKPTKTRNRTHSRFIIVQHANGSRAAPPGVLP
jgi:hypothetical protein